MSQEPVRRPAPMGQRYDPDPYWRQEQSVTRQSRPQELSNGQTKEQFVAEMLARPSNAESGPGRPQARPRQHQDASPAQGRPQSASFEKPAAPHDANSVRAKLELAKNAKLEATKRKLQEGYQEFDNGMHAATMSIDLFLLISSLLIMVPFMHLRRSREPYKWWIRKIYQSKGTTGTSNLAANQGITTSTATGIGQDEAPIPFSASDNQIPFKT
ncbi:hypothetical protein HU200_045887 [Digitaria exilis]|uniref:Uncharacterized protein n=1 Tax=Digitaria exilis TaxID=1010633 RepID=A0A835E9T7_9POAL|nr:hypothetical protein HU200_045887 [Digitaria exilis]